MPTIQELQTAIDNKQIDTRKLEPIQLQALDEAFKSGELKGYEGIKDYERLIDLGAQSVAGTKEQRLKAFETATGIDRGDAVLTGAAGMAMVPYMKNQSALLEAFQKNGFRDYYGVDNRFGGMADIYGKRFSVLSDRLKKLPKIPGIAGAPIRILSNVAGWADDTIDLFQKYARRGASPALATEAESILMGAGGAFGGSALYEIGNLGSDFVGATNQDMANLSDNDIRKMKFSDRLLYNSLVEAQNDILWAGGALGLIPAVRFAGRGLKGSLGLNSEQSKAIARKFESLGMRPSIAALIPGDNAWQNFFKKFFTTIGVYPIVGGPLIKFNKEFNQKLTQEKFLEVMEALELPPSVNNSIMNYAGANEIKNEWKRVWSAIKDEYNGFRKFYEDIGNPNYIPTREVKETSKKLLERLKEVYPERSALWDSYLTPAAGQMKKISEFDDPMVNYFNYLEEVGKQDHMRISDWLGLSKLRTAAYSSSNYKNVNDQLIMIRSAMERDLNSLSDATQRDTLKKIFKNDYDQLAQEQGPAAAEAFIDSRIRTAEAAFGRLKEANTFYSMVLRPFEKTAVGRKLRAQDAKLFADKGIEMVGTASLAPDEVFDKVITRILASDSPDSVRQLKQILGLTKSEYKIFNDAGQVVRTVKIPESKESRAVYDRYVKQFFWNAWNDSTSNKLLDLGGLSAQQIGERARASGFIRPRWEELAAEVEQRVRNKAKVNETFDVTQIDGRVFTQGKGIANLNEGLIANHNFGEVNIDNFAKRIGIDSPQGRDKLREMFGGGQKGDLAVKKLQDLIDVKRAIDTVEFTDPSKFVQRSLTLRAGSGSGIVAGASAAAFGIGQTLQIILGGRILASILASPKLAENVMDMNRYYRTLSDDPNVSKITPQLMPRARTAYARAINSIMENEGDDFRVNPNNIDFEEVRQKLLSLQPNIPLKAGFNFEMLPQFTRDRIYPEYKYASQLDRNQVMEGEEFMQGANLMAQSEEQFNAVANNNPVEQMPQQQIPQVQGSQLEMPQAPMGVTPTTGQQQPGQFAALFPQDTLGQAIAQQRGFNDGGLVEDAYARADEVLNA